MLYLLIDDDEDNDDDDDDDDDYDETWAHILKYIVTCSDCISTFK